MLSPESLRQMLDFVPIEEYGLGVFRAELQGREVWVHNGGTLGYTALMLYEPQNGISMSVLLNIGEDSLPVPNSNFAILNALLGVVLAQEPIVTAVESAVSEVPTAFQLQQNYPNPFNPQTTIAYQLAMPSQVTLTIYNTLGQEVRTLVNGHQPAGIQSAIWDGKDSAGKAVKSGIYFYKLKAGELTQTRSMLLVK